MFEIARQYDMIEQNPVRPMIHKPEQAAINKPTLTPEQVRAILAKLPADERLYNLLLAVTGMRCGEGLALRWKNFDEAHCEITITHTLYRGKAKEPKTKTSKGRLRLHPRIASLLYSHHQRSDFQGENDFIFCRADGSPWDSEVARHHLQKAMDAVGIHRVRSHHGFHIFRHTAATLLYEQSQDIGHVQSILRHADSGMTSQYVHVDKKVVEGAEVLTDVILGDLKANCDLFVTQTSKMVS